MKKAISILIVMVLLLSLAACGTAKEPTITVVPKAEYDALGEKHMSSLLVGMIIVQDWQDANEVEPERFMYYYASTMLQMDGNANETWAEGFIPAGELERFVQSHFDVSTEHLRTNRYYSAEKNAYEFGGLGSTASCEITQVVQTGNPLTIDYDLFGPMDYLSACGKLEIEMDGEEYKASENYKYLSNQFEWSAQRHLAFPSSREETDQYKVFMMDSGGRTSTSSDGINYKHYDGEKLASIIAFYENEALPALEAQGTADAGRYEDGWYWTGTYRGGRPLTIDVRHRYGADTYVITALYDEKSNSIVEQNMRERKFMQPLDLNDFSGLYGTYLWKPYYAGVLDDSWSAAEAVNGSSFVAFYALSLNDEERAEAQNFFPASDAESYVQRHFDIGTDTMRGWDVYDRDKHAYAYIPPEVEGVCSIVSTTSYGRGEDGEVTRIMIAYEVKVSDEDDTVIGSGELTIELSEHGYKYIANEKA